MYKESNHPNNYLHETGLKNIVIFLFDLKWEMFILVDF
jgi:hypothetical protein